MPVTVRLPTLLRRHADGLSSIEASGATLQEVLDDVSARYPALRANFYGDDGLHRFLNVYLNDDDVRFLGKLGTPVNDGDQISVLPAVAGG